MSTIAPKEIEKFSALADTWWDEEGPFKPLHRLNPTRIRYLVDLMAREGGIEGKTILDIGCGGGLLAEPLARLGGKITGIDASEKNIAIATLHAERMELSIDYRATSAETLAEEAARWDVVLAMEIIEHVADVPLFLKTLATLVKPGGYVFVATINRTPTSFLKAILGAEYILRWLPRGTHEWKKFVKPSEIARPLQQHGVAIQDIRGMHYSLQTQQWRMGEGCEVNYVLVGKKEKIS